MAICYIVQTGFGRSSISLRKQRGFAFAEALTLVVIVALVVSAVTFAYQLASFHADVRGVTQAFKELARADQLWHAADGDAGYSLADLQDSRLASSFIVDSEGVGSFKGLPFFFERQQTPAGFTTRVDSEAKARRIASLLGSKASYELDGSQFLVTFQPRYLSTLANLVDDHSIHTTASNHNSLASLAFTPDARVQLGSRCGFRDGRWLGGLAIDEASLKLAVCKREHLHSTRPERTWQLAGLTTVIPIPPTRQLTYCGSVGIAYDQNCCACTSLEQRQITTQTGGLDVVLVTCAAQPQCGDGTRVCDPQTDCITCGDGTNISALKHCSSSSKCGDGTSVANPATDCKTCWDGSNIVATATCPNTPTLVYCDDGLAVADLNDCIQCPHGTVAPYSTCQVLAACGNGAVVSDTSKDCKDCWDGTNIASYQSCPDEPANPTCDDGTSVTSLQQCKPCWSGTIGPSATCLAQPTCGDGSPVLDPTNDCKTCSNGVNQPVEKACETSVDCPCGGTASSLVECPNITMKACSGGCPSVCPDSNCELPTKTGPSSCASGYELTQVEGACTVEGKCVKLSDPCPCNGERDDQGNCPAVVKTHHQVSCPSGYNKVKTEAECSIQETCVKACPCGGGSVTFPATCPSITMKPCQAGCPAVCLSESCAVPERNGPTNCVAGQSLQETVANCVIEARCVQDEEPCPCGGVRKDDGTCPKVVKTLIPQTCLSGYQKVTTESECTINESCVRQCPCGGGKVIAPEICQPFEKPRNVANCPNDFTKVVTETECEINESCVKQCPCNGPSITHPDVCPAVTKVEKGPAACTPGYTRVKQAEDACSVTYACSQSCACSGSTVIYPDACPPIVKTEIGPAACPAGYTKEKQSETACTVTHQCLYVCPNGDQVNSRSDCARKACSCGMSDVLVGEDCPPVIKKVTGALTCPNAPGFSWLIVAEDACSITKSCLCTSTPTTCWTGPDACRNPIQVSVMDVNGVQQTGFFCETEGSFY